MISVCIATYNGEKYIHGQLDSILKQLDEEDEVIISDDSSTDGTLQIIQSYDDKRIRIFPNNQFHSPVYNFENALKQSKGEYIFLSDQDDVWLDNKVERMMEELKRYSLVVSNCYVVDKDCKVVCDSFWEKLPSAGVIRNLIKNNYIGCCMAFKREVLVKALPFPNRIAMHDIWLGLCGILFYDATFIPDKLMMYRRHGNNASFTFEKSKYGLWFKLKYRAYLFYCLFKRRLFYLFKGSFNVK